jgi:hypothetical protein
LKPNASSPTAGDPHKRHPHSVTVWMDGDVVVREPCAASRHGMSSTRWREEARSRRCLSTRRPKGRPRRRRARPRSSACRYEDCAGVQRTGAEKPFARGAGARRS